MKKFWIVGMLLLSTNIGLGEGPLHSGMLTDLLDERVVKSDTSISISKENIVTFDVLLTWGGFIGLNYERFLTDIISIEAGAAPTYYTHFGVLISTGVNLFLPWGSKHRLAGEVKFIFYKGGKILSEELEGIDVIANIAWRSYSYYSNNKFNATPFFGIFYQYKSDGFWIFRFGIGVINQLHDEDAPFIRMKIGYNF